MSQQPIVTSYTVRPPTFPDGHWMNRFWPHLARVVNILIRRVPFYRHVLRAPTETRTLLASSLPVIFACLHQDSFATLNALPRLFPNRPMGAITSWSRDGTLAAGALTTLGYAMVRGSSTRGGAEGLIALRDCLAAGRSVVLVCDGPNGPLGDVKAGVVKLASFTGAAIVPVRAWASLQLRMNRSWTRAALPFPFQAVGIFLGRSIRIPGTIADTRAWQLEVARSLETLAVQASLWAGGPARAPFTVANQ